MSVLEMGLKQGFGPLQQVKRESWLASLFYTSKAKPVNRQEAIVEEKVIQQLIKDIGLENTHNLLNSLDIEFEKRIGNIRLAMTEKSFTALATQAHALKSSAQVAGAYKLAESLVKLESSAKRREEEAVELAQQTLTLADLTRFVLLDVKLAA